MKYYMIVEPLIQNKFWCEQYIAGVRQEVAKNKGVFIQTTVEEMIEHTSGRERTVVLLNCISQKWIYQTTKTLAQYHIHCLIIAPMQKMPLLNSSSVSFDFMRVFYDLCRYLHHTSHNQIALFGINPISANDAIKENAFRQFKQHFHVTSTQDVFYNIGSLEDCCMQFYEKMEQFTSVICSNDVVALKLIHFLKERHISVPNDIYVATMGNTILSKFTAPRITMAHFDCKLIGRQAAKMYKMLSKNPDINSLSATVGGEITPFESTNFEKLDFSLTDLPQVLNNETVNFYSDEDVKRIFHVENLISKCDELDIKILHGLIAEKPIVKLTQELYTAENTIKYRISRMKKLAGIQTRSELLELFSDFLISMDLS